jgi:hypothetical protein
MVKRRHDDLREENEASAPPEYKESFIKDTAEEIG